MDNNQRWVDFVKGAKQEVAEHGHFLPKGLAELVSDAMGASPGHEVRLVEGKPMAAHRRLFDEWQRFLHTLGALLVDEGSGGTNNCGVTALTRSDTPLLTYRHVLKRRLLNDGAARRYHGAVDAQKMHAAALG